MILSYLQVQMQHVLKTWRTCWCRNHAFSLLTIRTATQVRVFNHTHDPSYDFRCLFSRLETWTISCRKSGCICLFTWDAFVVMTKERTLNPYCYSETPPNLQNIRIVEIPSQEADPATLAVLIWMVHIPWDKKASREKTSGFFLFKTKILRKNGRPKISKPLNPSPKTKHGNTKPKRERKKITSCKRGDHFRPIPFSRACACAKGEEDAQVFAASFHVQLAFHIPWCFKINSATSCFFFMCIFWNHGISQWTRRDVSQAPNSLKCRPNFGWIN